MDTERNKKAKRYEKIKLTAGITESIISAVLIFLFVFLGFSKRLESYAFSFTYNPYIALLIFAVIVGTVSYLISFAVDYVFSFRLEHKFGLSNQSFIKWVEENLKSLAVVIVLGAPILLLFYYFLLNYTLWWVWFGCLILVYSVILAQIAPVVIFPLFYKFHSISNENLKEKILNLCAKVGFKVKGVYVFNMSKTTKKANAAFTGIGRTKRIILGDTLVTGFSEDEILTVFAHELGHYKNGHIKKNILYSISLTFLMLFILSMVYSALLPVFGFANSWDIAALPLLALIAGVFGFLIKPIGSYISRRFEFEADRFAIKLIGNFDIFKSLMEKLAFQNLADENPNRFVEFWFRSHPSVKSRIETGRKYFNSLNILQETAV